MQASKARVPIFELPYSAGMVSQSCWFIEFRKLVTMIAQGMSDEELRRECVDNNLFGLPNITRAKKVYAYLIKRASRLDDRLTDLFMQGGLETQKQINLIVILRGDRLFFEFLWEVYREKLLIGQEKLEDADFSAFFRHKRTQSDVVGRWSDETLDHLRSNYTTCMADAGLLRMQGKARILQRTYVDEALQQYMQDVGEESVIRAVMGVM